MRIRPPVDERWRWPDRSLTIPALVAALVSFVVLGPVFGRGIVLAYDLAWSPDPRFTPYALGTGAIAPRAVPSDAVAIVLGHVLGAGVAQALVLWGTLVLAGIGSARLAALLAPELPLVARAVAAGAAIWNPFVLERLVVGHWTVLLGYAAVPHLLVSCVKVRRGLRPSWSPAVGIAACGVGGANALVIACLAVMLVLAAPRTSWRALGWAVLSTVGVSSVWALPALTARVTSSAEGVGAFASRADTPLGVLGSLVSGGGLWNPATHPSVRSVAVIAVLAALLSLGCAGAAARAAYRERLLSLAVPATVGLGLAWLSAADPGGLWSSLVLHLPGGGVLRDAQKLIAPWVVVCAAGSGVLARELLRVRSVGTALTVFVALLPVALLPTLAWGVGGRVAAVQVPTDLRAVTAQVSQEAKGTVGLLPWSQYRRYAWNGDRVSLTLVPRMVDRRMLFDDSLPLASGTVAGEDPAARRVGERIAAGSSPYDALAAEGVQWVIVEKQTGIRPDPLDVRLPPGAHTVHVGTSATVVLLPQAAAEQGSTGGSTVWPGWLMTCVTWIVAAACLARDLLRRRGNRLVGSAP